MYSAEGGRRALGVVRRPWARFDADFRPRAQRRPSGRVPDSTSMPTAFPAEGPGPSLGHFNRARAAAQAGVGQIAGGGVRRQRTAARLSAGGDIGGRQERGGRRLAGLRGPGPARGGHGRRFWRRAVIQRGAAPRPPRRGGGPSELVEVDLVVALDGRMISHDHTSHRSSQRKRGTQVFCSF